MRPISLTFGIICWVLMNCIIGPYTCYWMYQVWKRRNSLIIKKRKPKLLTAYTLMFGFWGLLATTFYIIVAEFGNQQIYRVIITIVDLVLAPMCYTIFGLALSRFWLLFFMINYNAAITKNQWKSVIDAQKAAENWYIQNKPHYGTWRSVRKWVIVYVGMQYIVAVILRCLVIVNGYSLLIESSRLLVMGGMFFCWQVIFPSLFMLFMRLRTSRFDDDIGIRQEFETNLRAVLVIMKSVWLTGIAFVASSFIIGRAGGSNTAWKTTFLVYSYFIQVIIAAIFSFMALKSTRWPLKTFGSLINNNPRYERVNSSTMIALVQHNTMSTEEQQKIVPADDEEKVKESVKEQMNETFLNEDLMDAFMEHLFAEYCAECLLSVIEFSQFKKFIKVGSENKSIADEEYAFEFCKSVPQSEIVFGSKSTDYAYIATKLYEKYIAVSAIWEININYATRNKYTSIFQNGGIGENGESKGAEFYYKLFDPCIDVMITLITPAFSRFKRTQKYKLMIKN